MEYIVASGEMKHIEVGYFVEISLFYSDKLHEVIEVGPGKDLKILVDGHDVWLSSDFIISVWRKI